MFIDTALNSVSTVLTNLHQSFHEAAVRCLEYVRVLAKVRTTCSSLLISALVPSPIISPFVAVRSRLVGAEFILPAAGVDALIAQITSNLQCSVDQYGNSYRTCCTDEISRDSRWHHCAGIRDGAASCAFSQRQKTCARAKHRLPTAAPVVSVADVNVSQLAGTELEVPFSPIAKTGVF